MFGYVWILGVFLFALCSSEPTFAAARFKHIILVIQENRTPDNLFGSNPNFEPGVDIAVSGVNSAGKVIPLRPEPLVNCYDLTHLHRDFLAMYNAGKMDGADRILVHPKSDCIVPHNPQFKYVDNSTGAVQPYFDIATRYGFANRMFQSNQGPSFPAHQFLFGATSAPDPTSKLFVSDNRAPKHPARSVGCTAPPSARVSVIDANGDTSTHPPVYPCFSVETLPTLLRAANLSWKYYTPSASGLWAAPTAIRSICVPETSGGTTACTGAAWKRNVVLDPRSILSDISDCKLPAVSWLVPPGQASDHAKSNAGLGPSWVASVINAVGNNPKCDNGETYWDNTAILVTWDDWGGWYDHVPPYRIGQDNGWGKGYVYGFRVPLLVVSAFTPSHYVDNTNLDFGSLLRFIEGNFGLGRIGPGTYADAYHRAPLRGFFPRTTPRKFDAIPSPHSAQDFIKMNLPPEDPDDE